MSTISRRTALAGIAMLVGPAIVRAMPAVATAPVVNLELDALLAAGWRRIPLGARLADLDQVPVPASIDLVSQK